MNATNQSNELPSLYHIPQYSPLVEVLDRRNGFLLLKNLFSMSEREMYTVAVEHDLSKSPHMPNKPDNTWVSAEQADTVMRSVVNAPTYNKALKDLFKSLE